MKRLLAIVVVSVGLGGPAQTLAAPTTIASLHSTTAVESYGAVAVWSDYDTADRSWHVVVGRDGVIFTLAGGRTPTVMARAQRLACFRLSMAVGLRQL
jgi:hypothetical protein